MRYFKYVILLDIALKPMRSSSQIRHPPKSRLISLRRKSARELLSRDSEAADLTTGIGGALNHARYLVKNGIAGGDLALDNGQLHSQTPQTAFRWEDKGRSFFTDDGAAAGRNAVVVTARAINLTGAEFLDLLMTMPFSGLAPMVPQFSVAGIGAYCDHGLCAIVISYRFALEKSVRIALYDGPASDRFWNPSLGLIHIETARLRTQSNRQGATVDCRGYSGAGAGLVAGSNLANGISSANENSATANAAAIAMR